MQFGKFSGWALVALGTLLIVVQIGFFSIPRRQTRGSPDVPLLIHHTTLLPSVLGGLFLICGFGLVFANRND
jgi:hypothetical protein